MLKLLQKLEQKCGFPHSRLGDDGHESPPSLDAVRQRCQRLPMCRAEVQVARIGCHAEWLLCEIVVVVNHVPDYALCRGNDASTGILRISTTSPGVRKEGSRYSAANAAAALTNAAKMTPISRIRTGLDAGKTGTIGGTAIATFPILFWSRASDVRSCSLLER